MLDHSSVLKQIFLLVFLWVPPEGKQGTVGALRLCVYVSVGGRGWQYMLVQVEGKVRVGWDALSLREGFRGQ